MADSETNDKCVRNKVKDYYTERVREKKEFKTEYCDMREFKTSKNVRDAVSLIHPDIHERFFGCGLVIPDALEGTNVLDLGSGCGLDCFVLSKLVGPNGHVTGVDMTEEQLDVARKYTDYHMEKFGYSTPNLEFVQGIIQDLGSSGIRTNFYDVIVSNCVLCACTQKTKILEETYKALKAGGEFYFSDMYADSELPPDIRDRQDMWAEGLSGALMWPELYDAAKTIGFSVPRLVSARPFYIKDKELREAVGDVTYVAATYRLFKMADSVTNSGVAVYNGGILDCESIFNLDYCTQFLKDQVAPVDPATFSVLQTSRFGKYFKLIGSSEDHGKFSNDPFVFAKYNKTSPRQ